jgi:DNA (cytosine-5)-methyltransferase 1
MSIEAIKKSDLVKVCGEAHMNAPVRPALPLANRGLKYFSMFSGIGGFEYGIEKATEDLGRVTSTSDTKRGRDLPNAERSDGNGGRTNAHCIGFSEIDKYAISIYGHHFPEHRNWGNCRNIVPDELPDFDLLVGGFPCQSFSIAGKRGGFEDTRGTLFFEIARIVKVKRPQLLLLENVKGLLSHDNGRTFGTILATLSELGYVCEWQILNSKDFGVPQNRERVFIVGHLGGLCGRAVFPIGESDGEIGKSNRQTSADIIDPKYLMRDCKIYNEECPTMSSRDYKEPFIVRINQLNNPTHSNNRVYGDNGLSPSLNTMQGGNRQPKLLIPEATAQGFAVAEEGDSINLSVPDSASPRGRVGKGVAQTIDTGMQQYTLKGQRIRRLTPVECERLQGFPDNWTKWGKDGKEISDSQRYKCLGNAVTTKVITEIMRAIKEAESLDKAGVKE